MVERGRRRRPTRPGPAGGVAPGADQGERLERGVVRVRLSLGAGVGVRGVSPRGVEVRDGDARLRSRPGARVEVEDGHAVAGERIPFGRPRGVFARVGAGSGVRARPPHLHRPVGGGEDLGLGLTVAAVHAIVVERGAGPTSAQDEVHRSPRGVEDSAVHGGHRAGLTGLDGCAGDGVAPLPGVVAAYREGPLVVVVVAADDQVDLVLVEQRQPFLADTEVRAVASRRRGKGILVHLDDDPVEGPVGAGGAQGPVEPGGLGTARIAAHVEGRAGRDRSVSGARRRGQGRRAGDERGGVLVDDVVGVERDEERGTDAERVPASMEAGTAVARQAVAGQVGVETLRAVVELQLMVARTGHPRAVRS